MLRPAHITVLYCTSVLYYCTLLYCLALFAVTRITGECTAAGKYNPCSVFRSTVQYTNNVDGWPRVVLKSFEQAPLEKACTPVITSLSLTWDGSA